MVNGVLCVSIGFHPISEFHQAIINHVPDGSGIWTFVHPVQWGVKNKVRAKEAVRGLDKFHLIKFYSDFQVYSNGTCCSVSHGREKL